MKKKFILPLLGIVLLTACSSNTKSTEVSTEIANTEVNSEVINPMVIPTGETEVSEEGPRIITEEEKLVMDAFMEKYVKSDIYSYHNMGLNNVSCFIGGEGVQRNDASSLYARACAFQDIYTYLVDDEGHSALHTLGNIHWVYPDELAQYLRFSNEAEAQSARLEVEEYLPHEVELLNPLDWAPNYNAMFGQLYFTEEGDARTYGDMWNFTIKSDDSIISERTMIKQPFVVDGAKYWLLAPNIMQSGLDYPCFISYTEGGILIGIDWDGILQETDTYVTSTDEELPWVLIPYENVPKLTEDDFTKIENYLEKYKHYSWAAVAGEEDTKIEFLELLREYVTE